jgi:hypothetical protein
MQIFESSLNGAERPCPPTECLQCGGCRKLHRHGTFSRLAGTAAKEFRKVKSQRYYCPECGRTWSVIPQDMFPSRSIAISRFQELADEKFGLASGDARPPPATVLEEERVRRACKTLSERVAYLCGLLGQQMPMQASCDLGCFWRALRELGSTQQILVRLARDFKTSLLRCYCSLRAHWKRKAAPA